MPLDAWEETNTTLHLYLQIVGKLKLCLAPYRNHWWNITFRVSPRGLTTGSIPYDGGRLIELEFDFRAHCFRLHRSWGEVREISLVPALSVAAFYNRIFDLLQEAGIEAEIKARPYDHAYTDEFATCERHASYDTEYIERMQRVLMYVQGVYQQFAGMYRGKVSPVQLYWHHMDLAVTRFSGRPGPELPETTNQADREAYSHEVVSSGFWFGDKDLREPAFYAYVYPSPDGLDQEQLLPEGAFWQDANGSPMAMLMYETWRNLPDPQQALLDFMQSAYNAGAKLADWPTGLV